MCKMTIVQTEKTLLEPKLSLRLTMIIQKIESYPNPHQSKKSRKREILSTAKHAFQEILQQSDTRVRPNFNMLEETF